jgi:hypothetical protein
MKLRQALLVAGLLPVAYGLNYLVTPAVVGEARLEVMCRPRGALRFDAGAWRRAAPASGVRYEMVDDLLARSGEFVGVAGEKVREQLGKPDLLGARRDDESVFYMLGDQRAHPAKSIWFPGLFANQDRWLLELRVRNGRVCGFKVFFT